MAQIFISYKRVDKDKVFSIVEKIEHELGCDCWVDLDGIESSVQFASVICSAIDKSDVVLFMHSSIHLTIDFETDWTVKELTYAQMKKKRVVLVKLDDTPLDNIFLMEYGSKNNIDSHDPSQFNKLLNDLRSWLHLPHHKSASQFEAMCPCGSGKLFKDCHGRSAVAPIVSQPVERTWKVGDYYNVDGKEGVVFWVDETGKHGKIVSLDEAKLRWCTYREFNKQKQIGASSDWDGNVNLSAVKNEDAWAEKYPSFSWCSNHGAQWYLPAYKELFELFKTEVVERVNDTLGNYGLDRIQIDLSYWSSTEAASTQVFVIHHKRESSDFSDFLWLDVCSSECFSAFHSPRGFKHEMYNVRAVAAF